MRYVGKINLVSLDGDLDSKLRPAFMCKVISNFLKFIKIDSLDSVFWFMRTYSSRRCLSFCSSRFAMNAFLKTLID
jgi:hypothetical protein